MSTHLLMEYIRLAVKEVHLARVPNQLVSGNDQEGSGEGTEDEGLDEFAGVGSISGYTAPLGSDPDDDGRQNNSRK